MRRLTMFIAVMGFVIFLAETGNRVVKKLREQLAGRLASRAELAVSIYSAAQCYMECEDREVCEMPEDEKLGRGLL